MMTKNKVRTSFSFACMFVTYAVWILQSKLSVSTVLYASKFCRGVFNFCEILEDCL